jgi:hypothetical protein
LLRDELALVFTPCAVPLAALRILMKFPYYVEERLMFYPHGTLRDIFGDNLYSFI